MVDFESYFEESGMGMSDVIYRGSEKKADKKGYKPKDAPNLKDIKHSRMTRNPHVG